MKIILGQVQLIVGLFIGKICPRPLPLFLTKLHYLHEKKPDIHLPCNTLLSYDYLNASGQHAAISVMSLREGGLWKVRERRCLVLRPEHEILAVIVFIGNEAKLGSWKPAG